MGDVAGPDLPPHLNEEVVDAVCVDRAPLNTTSVIVPLVVRISTRLGAGACCCPTPPSMHVLIGPLIFTPGDLGEFGGRDEFCGVRWS
jgi:hypothetical protein